ncbi:MAG TPA: contractile injection system protein, VgrG/Pvc8 family, partial [Gemmatimonadota bacterium]|nr:contractile injection system protein, VgrG/Pvc8 family [Gemmatimonadota bacterium]
MANYSQADRPIRVETALGEDALMFQALSGEEGISTPFSFTLDLVSEDPAIDPEDLLRKPVTISLQLHGGDERVIHGLVNRFVQLGQTEQGELTNYQAQVAPWLWFLSLSRECRIFQNLSVLEIAERVF